MMVLFIIIICLSVLIRVPSFWLPLTGYFGSYQTVDAMMAQNMVDLGLKAILMPQTKILIEGIPGLHLIYFPFCSLAAAAGKLLLGGNFEFWGRFQALLFMSFASCAFFVLIKKYFDKKTSLIAAFIFTFSPMVLIEGTMFKNEASAVFFVMLAALLISRSSVLSVAVGGAVFSLCLSARFHFIFLGPALLLLCLSHKKSLSRFLVFGFTSISLFGIWLIWTYWIEQQVPVVQTSFFSQLGEGRILNPILTDSAYWQRVGSILFGIWMGPAVIPFILWGLFKKDNRLWVPKLALLGVFLLLFILPKKIFDQPFYLIGAVAPAALLGAYSINELKLSGSKKMLSAFVAIFLIFSLRYFIPPIYFKTDSEKLIPEWGEIVQSVTEKNDRIIASNGSSCEFLYYTGRFGWTFNLDMQSITPEDQARFRRVMALGYGDPIRWIEHLIQDQWADYFVVTEPEKFKGKFTIYQYVTEKFEQIPLEHEGILIFKLN